MATPSDSAILVARYWWHDTDSTIVQRHKCNTKADVLAVRVTLSTANDKGMRVLS